MSRIRPLSIDVGAQLDCARGRCGADRRSQAAPLHRARHGSVLIIVIWICFGLVALAIYFANSMSSELRAADNRVASANAHQALLGGIRYAEHVLANYGSSGTPPLTTD